MHLQQRFSSGEAEDRAGPAGNNKTRTEIGKTVCGHGFGISSCAKEASERLSPAGITVQLNWPAYRKSGSRISQP